MKLVEIMRLTSGHGEWRREWFPTLADDEEGARKDCYRFWAVSATPVRILAVFDAPDEAHISGEGWGFHLWCYGPDGEMVTLAMSRTGEKLVKSGLDMGFGKVTVAV